MSHAELTVADETRPLSTAALRGRVDAVEGNRILGWAWHPERPRARITVTIFAGDDAVASAVADRPRVDLRRNGVGDGAHAFDIELEGPVNGPLRAVAAHPDGGADLDLEVPSGSQRPEEAAFAASFDPVLERLDTVIRAQHRLQQRNAGSLAELDAAVQRLATAADGNGPFADAVKGLADSQRSIADRLAEFEIFLIRFDGLIGDFNHRLDALAKQHVHPVKGHLLWLAAAVGVIVGVAITAAMRL